MISERIIIPVLQQAITTLRITKVRSGSVVSGKFGAVVRWNKRLVESLSVSGRRWALGRGKPDILLLWVASERVPVPRAEGVGDTRWVLKLLVVAEDNKEEEGRDT